MSTTEIISHANDQLASHSVFLSNIREAQNNNRKQLRTLQDIPHELLHLPLAPSPSPSPPIGEDSHLSPEPNFETTTRKDLPPAKLARVARYKNYVPEEETIRNDYSQRYVDGGEWPQNWVLGADPDHRFEEYPKQQRLLALKKAAVTEHSLPPTYLPFADLSSLHPCKFDVILIDPPFSDSFTWKHLEELPIPSLGADPSFVFLWVGSGSGEGLERGREILAKWGYRRSEDVVWLKTNKTTNKGPGTDPPTTSVFTRTKQHCLMGIRGTVRRSTDNWFVHCNVDTDIIIWEGDPGDPTRKPPEMYTLIENFCLGLRRLEIFGRVPSSLRRGWVTVLNGREEQALNTLRKHPEDAVYIEGEEGGDAVRWVKEIWEPAIKDLAAGGPRLVVPSTSDIDALRPKSPVRNSTASNNNQSSHAPTAPMNHNGVVMPMPINGTRFIDGNNPMNVVPGGVPGFMGGSLPAHNQMLNPGMIGGMGMNVLPGMVGMGPMGNGMMLDGAGAATAAGWPAMMGGMGGMGMPMMAGGFPIPGMFPMGNAGVVWDQGQQQFPVGGWDGATMMGMNNMANGMGMNMNMGMDPSQWRGNEGNF